MFLEYDIILNVPTMSDGNKLVIAGEMYNSPGPLFVCDVHQ